jgi:hypothetical protein
MSATKKIIDHLIEDFNKNKDTLPVDEKFLSKFDMNKKEHRECLSYVRGVGGYYIPFLKYLVKSLKLKTVVELGNQTGMSTVALYDGVQANETGSLYTVDIEKDQRFCPEIMFNDPRVHFLFGDVCSYDIIKQLPKNIDLLFTDTLHYDYQLRDEFEIYQYMLADTALIAIDDIRSNDKGRLFDEFAFAKWDLTELCHGSGWGLVLFERKNPLSDSEREEKLRESIMKVWERKYNRINSILEQKENTLWKKTKNSLKKISPLYKLYTRTFNYLHSKFFKKHILFYKR